MSSSLDCHVPTELATTGETSELFLFTANYVYKDFNIEFAELHNQSCNFDIEVNISENSETFDITIEYCNEVFRKETILKFWNDYEKMIDLVIENGRNCKISEISFAVL